MLTLGFAELTGMARLLASACSVKAEGTDSGAAGTPAWTTVQVQTGWAESPVPTVMVLLRVPLSWFASADRVNVTIFGLFEG